MRDLFGNLTLESSIEELELSVRVYNACRNLNLYTIGEVIEGVKSGRFLKARKTIFEIYELIRSKGLPIELPHWSLIYYKAVTTPEIEAAVAELDGLIRERNEAIHVAQGLNGTPIARLRSKIAEMRHATIRAQAAIQKVTR